MHLSVGKYIILLRQETTFVVIFSIESIIAFGSFVVPEEKIIVHGS